MAANKSFALLLLVALSLPGAAQAPPQRKAAHPAETRESPLLREAEAAIDKQDFATAEAKLRQALAADAEDYRAWFDLGFVYSSTGRKPQAIEAYGNSVRLQPDVFESTLNLGVLLAAGGDPAAEKYLRAATTLKPASDPDKNRARAWMALGRLLEAKNAADSLRAYEAASLLTPQDPEPRLAAAMVREKQGDYDAAEKDIKAAAKLDPASSEALVSLANLYMRTKRLPEAEAALRQCSEHDPKNATVRLQLGRVLRELGRRDEARAQFEAAHELEPNDPMVLRELAMTDAMEKRFPEAEARYRALVEGKPDDPELRYALGSILLQQHKYPAAEQELLEAVKLKPDVGEAYGDLAIAAAENRHFELAIKALDERARYLPEMAGTYFLRATSYDNLRAYPQAADFYRKFLVAAAGKFPDQEWQARHRLIAIEPKGKKK